MYFDGAFQSDRGASRVVFLIPDGGMIPLSFSLTEAFSRNELEYQALIIGLEITQELDLEQLNNFDDFELVIWQLKGIYDVRKDTLKPDNDTTKSYMAQFDDFSLSHIPSRLNSQADALSKLGVLPFNCLHQGPCLSG
ncbi:uncharacterized protein LOC110007530 [Amborella trichopoda]|uniref:uncharacterized protein LOC110007530 n=1 Tax=Amborella trichopoda TaxID=13333 RepID=UPI0009C0D94E|nr:uncharacterized protein LOC110007530 [Amborella trichopoda]|eukprot:XP_020524638.1 uncharacterized protein LOC110007530 [Amborella trichopoda]